MAIENENVSQETKDYIQKRMNWDGLPVHAEYETPVAGAGAPINAERLRAWTRDTRQFALRVRRDILVLEKLLIKQGIIEPADIYGDPGDPPPDPDI